MQPGQQNVGAERCLKFLRDEIEYNETNGVWPSVVEVANLLILRESELRDFFGELAQKLTSDIALGIALDGLISTAAIWNPSQLNAAREERKQLSQLNQDIAREALALSDLLQRRSSLQEESQFSTTAAYHIVDLFEKAVPSHHSFHFWTKKPLKAIRTQFSLKYWPTLSEVVSAIASDSETATIEADDEMTQAGTQSSRASKADFVRAWLARIEEDSFGGGHSLPDGFSISDSAMASATNCALDLCADNLVDGAYVKNIRWRQKASLVSGG
jgi:hypothetical protein